MRHRLSPACRWLGVFMLLVRVLGPAMPMTDAAGMATLAALFPGGLPICHATDPADPEAPAKAPAHDCQLCLACHGTAQAPLLPVQPVATPAPDAGTSLAAAVLPPATGPPVRPRRRSTPPIGPPALSI